MRESGLSCQGLSVSYGRRTVIERTDLKLGHGLYALMGPNGSGKSTLLRVLSGAQTPDAGNVWIDGISLLQSPQDAKQHLSYVPDEAVAYPFMTGQDLLDFCAWAKKTTLTRTIQEMIANFSLAQHLTTRFDALSMGTRKKISICAALVGAPTVILMDEPTNGLDAGSLNYLAGLLQEQSRRAVVLMSTHDDEFLREVDTTPLDMQDIARLQRT